MFSLDHAADIWSRRQCFSLLQTKGTDQTNLLSPAEAAHPTPLGVLACAELEGADGSGTRRMLPAQAVAE
ncbi:MAG: hypothetical protein JO354_10620 [Verrucomicrobia bacterium]|nr:hypothetical protein [Verrucomicrobiota bacterium]